MDSKRNTAGELKVDWHPLDAETPASPEGDAGIFVRFGVPPEFHAQFAAFVETGTGTDEFIHLLEQQAGWQLALEEAFARRTARLRDALKILNPRP